MSDQDLEKRVLELFGAAQDIPSDERGAWLLAQAGDDSALLARLEALVEADISAGEVLKTGGAKEALEEELGKVKRAGAYRVTGLIGRGGMGDVYKGERDQGDFNHAVAIKVIKPGLVTESIEARLKTERQILADLNHPGIARLFDGGELEDGSPYIIMEYIEGEPITQWADKRALSLVDRLWLFSDLCRAVQYAHQNLIVHRDITPSNVLVTEKGVLKLIDFGIAKPQDVLSAQADAGDDVSGMSGAVSGPPSLASLSFTPGFAAPERGRGAQPNILSDIFSLGRLLEHLVPKAQSNRDLQAIVKQATQNDPAARYASVDNLRDEIMRYVEGRPVEARHGGGLYRFAKLFKRRWLPMTAGLVAAGALVAGLVVTTGLYQRAEAARVEADGRFEDVRELAGFMLFDLYDELQDVPGNTRAMSKLADEAQAYLEGLSQSDASDIELRLEAASGLNRIANILGNPNTKSLGRRADSREVYKTSYERLEALHTQAPDNRNIKRALAEAAYDNSIFQYIAENVSEPSFVFAEESVRLYDELIAEEVTEADRIGRAFSVINTARPLVYMARGEEALSRYDTLELEIMSLLDTASDQISAKRLAGQFFAERANSTTLHKVNTLRQADPNALDPDRDPADFSREIGYAQKGIAYLDAVLEQSEDPIAGDINRLAKANFRLGQVYAWAKSHKLSEEALLVSQENLERLLENDPDNRQALRLIIAVRTQLAQALWRLSRADEAVEINNAILSTYQSLRLAEPDSAGHIRDFGAAYLLAGNADAEAGDLLAMCRKFNLGRLQFLELEARFGIADSDRNNFLNPMIEAVDRCKRDGLLIED